MSVFMKEFRDELENIAENDIEAPDDELKPGDKVVGTIENVEVRKIFGLAKRLSDEMTQLKKDIVHKVIDLGEEALFDSDEVLTLRYQFEMLTEKLETVKKLLWTCIKHELPEEVLIESYKTESDGICIRKDWQIVLIKSEGEFDLGALFSELRRVMG